MSKGGASAAQGLGASRRANAQAGGDQGVDRKRRGRPAAAVAFCAARIKGMMAASSCAMVKFAMAVSLALSL